jgi:malate dehydrogenase
MAASRLEGVVMEINDCTYPLLESVIGSDSPEVGFTNADVCILLGGYPRLPGMERKDLLAKNVEGIKQQAEDLAKYTHSNVKVLVVANPANTNCLIAMEAAPSIPRENFSCLTRLDEERFRHLISLHVNESRVMRNFETGERATRPSDLDNVIVLGNHSSSQVPCASSATVKIGSTVYPVTDFLSNDAVCPDIINQVQRRGAEIIKTLGASSAASAANAIARHLKDWLGPISDTSRTFSMGIYSQGNKLNIPENLVFSLPCRRVNGSEGGVAMVNDFTVPEQLEAYLASTIAELTMERQDAIEIFNELKRRDMGGESKL